MSLFCPTFKNSFYGQRQKSFIGFAHPGAEWYFYDTPVQVTNSIRRVFETAESLIEAWSGDSRAGITPRSDASAFYSPVDRNTVVR